MSSEAEFVMNYAQCADAGIEPRVERRVMHWAVQHVDQILASADTLPGITHSDAAYALYELGVSQERVRDLLSGNRRASA